MDALTRQATVLAEAARAAHLAPSTHNTQPWRFVIHDDAIDVRADRGRQLRVLDPSGRELHLACGAALFNIRVVLAACGFDMRVSRLPDHSDPDLLARVTLAEPTTQPDDIGGLEAMIDARHTNRRAFAAVSPPQDVVDRLEEIAEDEGALLLPIVDEDDRLAVARLTQAADALQNADPAYRAELRRWVTRDPERTDGVPMGAVPAVDGEARDMIPIRDFDTSGEAGLPAGDGSARTECLLLLGTDGDGPLSWLRVGEAMQHVWLELTRHCYVVSPMTQITEVPATNERLRLELRLGMHPQMLLRVGRAPVTPPTPRRPLQDVASTDHRP